MILEENKIYRCVMGTPGNKEIVIAECIDSQESNNRELFVYTMKDIILLEIQDGPSALGTWEVLSTDEKCDMEEVSPEKDPEYFL